MKEIDNRQDIIDSREIIERIEELQETIDDYQSNLIETIRDRHESQEKRYAAEIALQSLRDFKEGNGEYSEEKEELQTLVAFAEEAEGYSEDWKYGATLIRESYFVDYAKQLAEDIGAVERYMDWPCNCIDWEQAAEQLKMDYITIDFNGVDYYVRS